LSAPAENLRPPSPRSAARLSAVQALYQLMIGGGTPARVLAEFRLHRAGETIDGATFQAPDGTLLADLVDGVWDRRAELDERIASNLAEGWTLDRLDTLLHQILRAGVYELVFRKDIPPLVTIHEYVDVANAFYEAREPAFVNGLLDKVAKDIGKL
jgi:transcription antitermination protein NusB